MPPIVIRDTISYTLSNYVCLNEYFPISLFNFRVLYVLIIICDDPEGLEDRTQPPLAM